MTRPFDPLAETLGLLAAFERSDWAECHVRTAGLEVFLSRRAQVASPMTEPPAGEAAEAVDAGDLRLLAAPHVGTLRSIAAAGERVRAGAAWAVVELLDEVLELIAEHDGVAVEALARPGELVEHDQPLLSLRAPPHGG
jgi:biotin carboxyl carrier protein